MDASPEELLQRLAATPPHTFPREVLEEMVARLDEMKPALLRELERFVEAPDSFDEDRDWITLTYAAFLLAEARETRAFKPLVALLSQSRDQVRRLWDDLITDSMGRILASVYDGDEPALRGLIENPEIEEYVRGASAIHCLETLALAGRIPREDLETYYGELLESKLEKSPGLIWDAVCSSIGDFGFGRLLPAVERAFAEGICNPCYNCFEDIVVSVELAGLSDGFSGSSLTLVADTIAETEWWACFQPEYDPENQEGEDFIDEHWYSPEEISGPLRPPYVSTAQMTPYSRPSPKIGRNDPCPCGSGKKYKKCCG